MLSIELLLELESKLINNMVDNSDLKFKRTIDISIEDKNTHSYIVKGLGNVDISKYTSYLFDINRIDDDTIKFQLKYKFVNLNKLEYSDLNEYERYCVNNKIEFPNNLKFLSKSYNKFIGA